MQRFRSKKDWWVLAFIICMTGLLLQLLLTMQVKGTLLQYPVHSLVYIVTIAVIWWPLLNTQYLVHEQKLHIRSLFFSWHIPLEHISKVSKTQNSIASPALSLGRLKIDYIEHGKSKFILVSPKDQDEFCQALNQSIER